MSAANIPASIGNGNVTAVDGNKLTIQFDKAGEKRVVGWVCGEGLRLVLTLTNRER